VGRGWCGAWGMGGWALQGPGAGRLVERRVRLQHVQGLALIARARPAPAAARSGGSARGRSGPLRWRVPPWSVKRRAQGRAGCALVGCGGHRSARRRPPGLGTRCRPAAGRADSVAWMGKAWRGRKEERRGEARFRGQVKALRGRAKRAPRRRGVPARPLRPSPHRPWPAHWQCGAGACAWRVCRAPPAPLSGRRSIECVAGPPACSAEGRRPVRGPLGTLWGLEMSVCNAVLTRVALDREAQRCKTGADSSRYTRP
jgi:hypothetical protein